MQEDEIGRYLATELRRHHLTLFTGAGFSSDATDHGGRRIPTGLELADELWPLCFAAEGRDPDSSLEDLFHLALAHHPGPLARLLEERLTIAPQVLPSWYEVWFALPW